MVRHRTANAAEGNPSLAGSTPAATASPRRSAVARTIRVAYERGYRVDETGAVQSPHGTTRCTRLGTGGYATFNVKLPRSRLDQPITVHQLQAYQKFGLMALANGVEVRHLNGVKTDNRPDNIAIGNHSDNMMDRLPQARLQSSLRGSHKQRRLSQEEARQLRADHRAGLTYKALMAKYNLAKTTVSYIVNKKTYKEYAVCS